MMKFFFWNLNDKERLIRACWTGFVLLVFLYAVCLYHSVNMTIAVVLTVIYVVDLARRYMKIKRVKERA